MFSVELPDSSEVGLFGDVFLLLMGINNIVLGNEFRNHCGHFIPLLSEMFSAFLSCGVNAEDQRLLLVGMSEGVEVLVGVIKVTTVGDPSWIRSFVIEQS